MRYVAITGVKYSLINLLEEKCFACDDNVDFKMAIDRNLGREG